MAFDKFYSKFNAAWEKHLTDCDVVLGADSPENRIELRGTFDRAYLEVERTESRQPVVTVPDQAVGVLKHSKKMAIKEDGKPWQAYEVVERRPDSKGHTLLYLHHLGHSCIDVHEGGFPYVFPIVFGAGKDGCVNIDDE